MQRKTALLLLITVLTELTLLFNCRMSDMHQKAEATLSQYGSTGSEVTKIQTRLLNWGYYKGSIDGDYGYLTYNAIKSFQAKNGLSVDGIAGPETLAALGLPSGQGYSATTTGTSAGSGDLNLLAHIIYGEARGEPYEGQVAVGAVILNRTRDSRFPGTIAGVIYQPGAFDAVDDGQINLSPDSTAINAARDALNGWDPTYGCVYYYNPSTATSSWIWSRPIIIVIGRHNFAK